MRMISWPPTTGSSITYWDDVGLIEWEDWIDFGESGPIPIDNPNDYTYLQIRTDTNITNQQIFFIETFYGLRTENASDLQLNQCTKVTPRPPLQNVPI